MKGRKKLFIVTLFAIAIMSCCVAFAACNKHTHEYYQIGETAWTKTDDGYSATITIGCTGDDYYEVVDCTVTSSETNATCTAGGTITYTASCTVDGNTFTDTKTDDIAALGHNYEYANMTAPTAESEGSVSYSCSRGDDSGTITLPVITFEDYDIELQEDWSYVCTYLDKSDISFTVKEGDWEILSLSRSALSLEVDETKTVTATAILNNGNTTNPKIEAETEASCVTVSVSDNTITIEGKSEGSATITVTYGEQTKTLSVTVAAKSEDTGEAEYEWVTTYADLEAALNTAGGSGSNYKPSSDLEVGKFTFGSGVYFEYNNSNFSGGYDVNNQQKNIYFTVSGTQNNLAFDMVDASSNVSSGSVTLYKNDGTVVYTWTYPSGKVSVNVYTNMSAYLDAGTYYIGSVGSLRIGNLYVAEYLEVSDPESITATASTKNFLVGSTLTATDLGLNVTLNYENGRQDSLTASQLTTDLSTLTLRSGENYVTVTYTSDDSIEYTDIVTVYAYIVESIEISDFSMSYAGGVYYTNSVQKIFLAGDNINYDNAAITATAYYGAGKNKVTQEFILTSDQITFGLYDSSNSTAVTDLSKAGTYTVRATVDASLVRGASVSGAYTINVIELNSSTDKVQVKVDQSSSLGQGDDGVITVNTITDALCLIKLLGASDSERKFIYVSAGQYNEKIYIDIPNLSLIGSNPSEETNLATRSEVTEIVFDAMNGVMDPSGTTTYSTVGSATVTIASGATGFYAANITFRNYWNTNELYNEALKITSSTQADAAYINADKSYFYNVTFTSYHDTLEAENGRQVYDHCYIEGRTDYIFGNTATCYFGNCTIHSIGAGTDEKNGGYVVATKGGSSSAHVAYGYIFDTCTFEGDENVQDGSVSLGRGWDVYMTMAVINCSISKSFSTEGYGNSESSLNDRYTKMNAEPVASQLFEYGNTGDGAITVDGTNYVTGEGGIVYEVVNGVQYPLFTALTEDSYKDYTDFSKIFASTNGTYTYSDSWDGTYKAIKITVQTSDTDETVLYTIYGTNSMSLSDLKAAIDLRLTDVASDKIYNASTKTEITDTITSDTTIYFTTREIDYTVTESVSYSVSGGDFEELGSGESKYLGKLFVEGAFTPNNDWYLLGGSISVKLQAGSTITVVVYNSGDTLSMTADGQSVTFEAVSGNSGIECTYKVETDCTLVLAPGSGTLYVKSITISVPVIYKIGDKINLKDYSGDTIQGATGEYKGISIDASASGAKFAPNGNSVQYNSGTIMKINVEEGATVEIEYYSGYAEKTCTIEVSGGVVTITGGNEQTYIVSITIVAASNDNT